MLRFHGDKLIALFLCFLFYANFLCASRRTTAASDTSLADVELRLPESVGDPAMLRSLIRSLIGAKPKRSADQTSSLRFEHLEPRHLFSTTPLAFTTTSAEQSPAAPLEYLSSNSTPLDSYSVESEPSSYGGAAAASVNEWSLWSNATTPPVVDVGDPDALELGVKFTANTDGYLTGLRFYKSAANTGPHTANLWTSSGQLLATATFTNETASGWQEVTFASPVSITAGTTYVASYFAPNGHFAVARSYFRVNSFSNGPLTAPVNGGVFKYGTTSAFPSQSFLSSNYWVDVVFTATAPTDTTPPTVTSTSPANGATNFPTSAAVTVTFSEAIDPATISSSTVKLLDGSSPVAASVSYNAANRTVTITPNGALTNSKTYTISILGGAGGVKDLAGNALAQTATSSFTTIAATDNESSLWSNATTPPVVDVGDPDALELGVKFTANTDGYLTGLRFYKSAANTGPHTANLWTSSGQLLATATFTNETASGWQEVTFASPVSITPARPTWPRTSRLMAISQSLASYFSE